jgi:hypothetical protein
VSDQSISLDPKRNSFRLPHALVFVAAAAVPVLVIILLVIRYAVAIPMLDDWEMVPLVVKAHTGGLTWNDLFEQQQEARTFFPKLIFIILSTGKCWDGRVEMMLSVLICCLTALGIYQLTAKSGLSSRGKTIAFLLMVPLIFSPAQHELWLLASGFPSFVPALCIVWGLCAVRSDFSIVTKFGLCASLALFASFTLANGLLAWGFTFPILLATQREPHWKRWLAFWLLATAACAAIYFWHFHSSQDLPPFAPRKPVLDYLRYVAAFLGSGLGRSGNDNPLAVSIGVGTVFLLGYFISLGLFIFRCRDGAYCARVAPWIALGGYSVGSGCLAALGRIEWGVSQALESRYVAFSLYLAVALIAMVALFARDLLLPNQPARRRLPAFTLVVFLGAGCLLLEILSGVASLPFFQIRSAAARLGQSGVLFCRALDTSSAIKSGNFPRPFFVRENADALDRLHLLRTPLVRTREIGKLRKAGTSEGAVAGWCDGLTTASNGARVAWGWATLTERRRPADAVLLAYADERGEWIAFALSDAVIERPDVVKTLGKGNQIWSGWRAIFAPDAAPAGAEISAWAVDAKEPKLYRLKAQERIFNL